MDESLQENLILSSLSDQIEDLQGKVCEESKKRWRVALPSIVSRVTSFGTIVVTQSFIGHISSTDLAGYALVQTLSVRFANGIVGIWIGMISGFITQTLAVSFMTWKTNWDEEVSKTSARLERWYLKSGEENK